GAAESDRRPCRVQQKPQRPHYGVQQKPQKACRVQQKPEALQVQQKPQKALQGHLDDDMATCKLCAPGSYSPEAALTQCIVCYENSYSEQEGSTECARCPENTKSITESVSRAACLCKSNYYLPSSSEEGDDCEECPLGAVCAGDYLLEDGTRVTQTPVAKEGWWWTDTADEAAFVECFKGAAACMLGTPNEPVGRQEEELETKKGQCEDHYEGFMCNKCEGGDVINQRYHQNGSRCEKCEGGPVWSVLYLLCPVFVLGGFFQIILTVSRRFPSMNISYPTVQILSLVGFFRINWGSSTDPKVRFFKAVDLVNFNVEPSYLDCSANLDFQDLWWIKACGGGAGRTALPIVHVGLRVLFTWATIFPWGKCVEESQATQSARGAELMDACIPVILLQLKTIYIPILRNNLQVMVCDSYGGVDYLRVAPDVECWSTSHTYMFTVAVVSFIFYNIGLPVVYGYIVHAGMKTKHLSSKEYTKRYGFMYVMFRPNCAMYSIVDFMHKSAFTVLEECAQNIPIVQVCGGLIVLLVRLLIDFYASPYMDMLRSVQARLCNLLQFLFLILGCFYYIRDCEYYEPDDPSAKCYQLDFYDALFWVLVHITFGGLLCGFVLDIVRSGNTAQRKPEGVKLQFIDLKTRPNVGKWLFDEPETTESLKRVEGAMLEWFGKHDLQLPFNQHMLRENRSPVPVFFHAVLRNIPMFFDYISVSSLEERHVLKRIITRFQEFKDIQDSHDHESFSHLFEPSMLPHVAAWLLDSTVESQTQLNRIRISWQRFEFNIVQKAPIQRSRLSFMGTLFQMPQKTPSLNANGTGSKDSLLELPPMSAGGYVNPLAIEESQRREGCSALHSGVNPVGQGPSNSDSVELDSHADLNEARVPPQEDDDFIKWMWASDLDQLALPWHDSDNTLVLSPLMVQSEESEECPTIDEPYAKLRR
ncbi:hypothetical protein CYMTET_19937, partial [Cymbomonas tetramitiformis]